MVAALGDKLTAQPFAPLVVPGFAVVCLVPAVHTTPNTTNLIMLLLLLTVFLQLSEAHVIVFLNKPDHATVTTQPAMTLIG